MTGPTTHNMIRGLWTGAGVCTVAVGVADGGAWEGRLVVILSGIVTLLLSILLGGFIKHLSEHADYNRTLEASLNGRVKKLFEVLEKTDEKLDSAQTKVQCEMVNKFLMARLSALEDKIDTLLKRHGEMHKK